MDRRLDHPMGSGSGNSGILLRRYCGIDIRALIIPLLAEEGNASRRTTMKLSTVCLSIALAITLTAVKPLAAHHSDEDSFGTRSLLRPSHAFLSSSAAAIQWCRHCGGASAAVAGRPCEPRIDGRQKGYWEVRPGLSGLPRAADVPFQPWARALYQYRTSR